MLEYIWHIFFSFNTTCFDCLHSPFEIVVLFLLATVKPTKKSGRELRQAVPGTISWMCDWTERPGSLVSETIIIKLRESPMLFETTGNMVQGLGQWHNLRGHLGDVGG